MAKKYSYKEVSDPICICLNCKLSHLMKDRKKIKCEGETKKLFKYLCPKCDFGSYLLEGDRYTKVRVYKDE